MNYPVTLMKGTNIDNHFREVLQPQHSDACIRYEKYESKQIKKEEESNKTLHQRILNSKQKKPTHMPTKKEFPPEAYMYQRGYYVPPDNSHHYNPHQIPGYYPGIPNQQQQQQQQLHNHLNTPQGHLSNGSHLNQLPPHLPPHPQQQHTLNSNHNTTNGTGQHLNNGQHLNINGQHLENNTRAPPNHPNTQPPPPPQHQIKNLPVGAQHVKMQPQIIPGEPVGGAPVQPPPPQQDIKPNMNIPNIPNMNKNKSKRSPSPTKLENAPKKPNYGLEVDMNDEYDFISQILDNQDDNSPEIGNLIFDADNWNDSKDESVEEVKPSVSLAAQQPPIEPKVEPSPLSKVPPPNVTISTNNMNKPASQIPASGANGQGSPNSPQTAVPNIQIAQSPAMSQPSHQPNLQLAQPGISEPSSLMMPQPNHQISQPSLQMSQPNIQMSQPNIQMSQPTQQMSQPTQQMSQPTHQISQPNMSQPSQHMSQPSQHMSQPTQPMSQPTQHMSQPTQHMSQPTQHMSQPSMLVGQQSHFTTPPSPHVTSSQPAPPPYTQSNGAAQPTTHILQPTSSFNMTTVAMATNKGMQSSQYGLQPRSPHVQITNTGSKMSTHCTETGIMGGLLNRAQVPNVTVTPGYNQPNGTGQLGSIPNYPNVRSVEDHDKLANSKLLLNKKLKEQARQGQSDKQRQKLEAEYHRNQQAQQQQHPNFDPQSMRKGQYPMQGVSQAHFTEHPGFNTQQPNFNQRNYFIMQQQAQQQQQQLQMYYQMRHVAANNGDPQAQQQLAAQHQMWARQQQQQQQQLTPQQQQQHMLHQHHYYQQMYQQMYQQKAKSEGVPSKAEPMFNPNMANSRNVVCGPGGRYILPQQQSGGPQPSSQPQQPAHYGMYHQPIHQPLQIAHPRHQINLVTSSHPTMTSSHPTMTSSHLEEPEPTLTQPTLNQVAIKSSPKLDSKQNELDDAILENNFSRDEIDMFFDISDPFNYK